MDNLYEAEKSKLIRAMRELKRDLQTEANFADIALAHCEKEKFFEAFAALRGVSWFPKYQQERKMEIFLKRYFPEIWGEIEKYMYPGKKIKTNSKTNSKTFLKL